VGEERVLDVWSNHKAFSLHHSTGKKPTPEEREKRKKEERTKETIKVEHDFVLNVSPSFLSS
jgi:hypothetical protein